MCTMVYAVPVAHKTQKRAPDPLNWSYRQLSTESRVFCKGTSAPKPWGTPLAFMSSTDYWARRWDSNCYGQMITPEGKVEEGTHSHIC